MRRKIPSLQALSCFDAAARHESYTRAATELAMTQGAVSRQIAALEAFLGVALFRRTRHGVALTPAGAQYARQVATRLDTLERDTLDAMAHHGSGGGTLQLAAVPTFATRWLLPRLPRLMAEQPELVVHIETRTRPFLFADSGFDAALYAGTPEQVVQWPGIRAVHLLPEVVVPVCSPALFASRRRWDLKALAATPLLQQSTRPDAWRQWFEAQDIEAPGALSGPRYELFTMLAVAATHGLGVALVPRMLVEAELARGELVVPLASDVPSVRSYYLVSPEAPQEPPALTVFRDWLLRELA
ncbi:MAG: LysR substrate-binding domain-containing protein [Burkholderiales bacterium]